MKPLAFLLLYILCSWNSFAQTHNLALNIGGTRISSINDEPPFGANNSWEAIIGYSTEFNYHFTSRERFTYGLNFNVFSPRFIDKDRSELIPESNEVIIDDRISIHTYFALGVSVGYKWYINNRYGLHFSTGTGLLYNAKQKSYLLNHSLANRAVSHDLTKENTFYLLQFGVEQSYTLIKGRDFRLNLLNSIRIHQIFNYMKLEERTNRLLPQAYLGLELELGRRQR